MSLEFHIYEAGDAIDGVLQFNKKTASLKAGGFFAFMTGVLSRFDVFEPAWGFHVAEISRLPDRIYFWARRP